MVVLTPGSQLLVMSVFAVFLRLASSGRSPLPTPAGAAVMALGIFIAAALQEMRPLGPLITQTLSIALVVLWGSMATSYVTAAPRASLQAHGTPVIGRFAIGTWVAATAVLARVVLLGVPEWQAVALALAVVAAGLWLWFLKLAVTAMPVIVRTSSRCLTPGVILLVTVSTQSLALVALDLAPAGSIRHWLVAALIGAGALFYVIGAALVLYSHASTPGWRIAEDWDNTNCILHGAMSITGLALASNTLVPAGVTLSVWYYVLLVFIAVESVEAIRLALRVKELGWQQGAFSYRVTQWSRNFTFGMFYAFTLQLPANVAAIDPIGWMPAFRSVMLVYGPYAVLIFLLAQLFIYLNHLLEENRARALNPWSLNRYMRRRPASEDRSDSTLLPMLIAGLVLILVGAAVVMIFV